MNTRRPNTLDQFTDIGGSRTQLDSLDISQESSMFGRPISGQFGSAASISAFVGGVVTLTGLTGITNLSIGRSITIVGASSAGNNSSFIITAVFGSTTINYENANAVAPDLNNGSISWVEREPYTLEDDINYRRTNEKLIKGTGSWNDPIPTYNRPTDVSTDVDANLSNVAGKTLDAHAWIESRFKESIAVSPGSSFITILDAGNLKHADTNNIIGIPVYDGYDAGNELAAFVEIVDAELDGYGDGGNLRVLSGGNSGERIFGLTRAGGATSPDMVEIAFYSVPITDWNLSTITPYTWESEQSSVINISYGYRQRLDLFDENAIRSVLVYGALSGTAGSGSGSGSGSEVVSSFSRHFLIMGG